MSAGARSTGRTELAFWKTAIMATSVVLSLVVLGANGLELSRSLASSELSGGLRTDGSPQLCEPCPTGYTGCSNIKCTKSPPPTCNGAAISNVSSTIQSGYRQAWVNWTFSGTQPIGPSFTWSVGGSSLVSPAITSGTNSASVNLNDLSSGTTYAYIVYVSNCAGTGSQSGQFTTANAPTSGFVGWVYAQSLNGYLLDPDGAPLSGVSLAIEAHCTYLGLSSAGMDVFDLGTTNSAGYYSSTFPLTSGDSGGPYSLSATGVCTTSAGSYPAVSNTNYLLEAEINGYYFVNRWISSALTAANDFQTFALPANIGSLVPVSLALIHTTYSNGITYNNAACDLSYYTSTSVARVAQTIGLNGQAGTAEKATAGSGWDVTGAAGADVGLDLQYPFSGGINDSALTTGSLLNSSNIVGSEYGVSSAPYTSTDWMTAPTYSPTATPGSAWVFVNPVKGGPNITQNLFTSGTYSSTSGYNVDLGLSVGWAGQSASVSIPIQATTTVTTTITNTLSCTFSYVADPLGGNGSPYFWVYVGSPATSVVHVWLVGWCGGSVDQYTTC